MREKAAVGKTVLISWNKRRGDGLRERRGAREKSTKQVGQVGNGGAGKDHWGISG